MSERSAETGWVEKPWPEDRYPIADEWIDWFLTAPRDQQVAEVSMHLADSEVAVQCLAQHSTQPARQATVADHNAETVRLAAVKAVADRWEEVLGEVKATDSRWILDRSTTVLDSALVELRRALSTPPIWNSCVCDETESCLATCPIHPQASTPPASTPEEGL